MKVACLEVIILTVVIQLLPSLCKLLLLERLLHTIMCTRERWAYHQILVLDSVMLIASTELVINTHLLIPYIRILYTSPFIWLP